MENNMKYQEFIDAGKTLIEEDIEHVGFLQKDWEKIDKVFMERERNKMKFSREWAMPNSETFSIPCIKGFVDRYLSKSKVSVDPFARNNQWATHTNDLNTFTNAACHLDVLDFLKMLKCKSVKADLVIFDPPYSPRQISECYQSIGRECGMEDTQISSLHKNMRSLAMDIITNDAVVLSFGWNTVGMGIERGFEIIEIMLVCHGGGHNDTICMAERLVQKQLFA